MNFIHSILGNDFLSKKFKVDSTKVKCSFFEQASCDDKVLKYTYEPLDQANEHYHCCYKKIFNDKVLQDFNRKKISCLPMPKDIYVHFGDK